MYYAFIDPLPLPLVIVMSVVNLDINNFNLTMKCLPDKNHLHYQYKWIKRNDNLLSKAQGINSSHLTIYNLKPEDSGEYQCTVSNRTGKISSDFTTVDIIGNDHEILYATNF